MVVGKQAVKTNIDAVSPLTPRRGTTFSVANNTKITYHVLCRNPMRIRASIVIGAIVHAA